MADYWPFRCVVRAPGKAVSNPALVVVVVVVVVVVMDELLRVAVRERKQSNAWLAAAFSFSYKSKNNNNNNESWEGNSISWNRCCRVDEGFLTARKQIGRLASPFVVRPKLARQPGVQSEAAKSSQQQQSELGRRR